MHGALPAELSSQRCSATAIEYGLVAALIAVAAISAMQEPRHKLRTTLTNVSKNMKAS